MTEEQKKNAEKKIMYLSFGILGLAVVFLLIVGFTGQAETMLFPVGLGVFLAIYWAVADLLPIKWADIFDGRTEEQKQAYWIYTLLDAGGLAGLVYFIVNMESMVGVIIFAGCTMFKRKFNDRFLGKTDEEEDVAEPLPTAENMQEIIPAEQPETEEE